LVGGNEIPGLEIQYGLINSLLCILNAQICKRKNLNRNA